MVLGGLDVGNNPPGGSDDAAEHALLRDMMKDRRAALLLLVSFAMLAQTCRVWWPYYTDDSYITLRYAKNWVDGFGPVFNPGEPPVEGYSNPLWMAAMAGAIELGLDPVPTSKWLGVVFAGGLIAALFAALVAVGVPGWAAALATWPFASCELVGAWSVAGLETVFYAFLLFAGLALLAVRQPTRATSAAASVLLSLAALTRPEGVAIWLGGLGFLLLFRRRDMLAYVAGGLLLPIHLVWRHSFYGEWLPNTYYVRAPARESFWISGLPGLRGFLIGFHPIYFTRFFPVHALWLIAALLSAAVASRYAQHGRRALLMIGVMGFYFAYIASVGDDNQGFFRYHVALLAPLAYLTGLGFAGECLSPRMRTVLAASLAGLACYAIVAQSLHPIPLGTRMPEGNERLGRFLAAYPRSTRIAVGSAGAIPYFSGLPTIDMYGLSDRHVARMVPSARTAGSYPGHEKFDTRYVLSLRPDIVVPNLGYFPKNHPGAAQIDANPLALSSTDPLNESLFAQLYWNPDYALRALDLGGGDRYFVFERATRKD